MIKIEKKNTKRSKVNANLIREFDESFDSIKLFPEYPYDSDLSSDLLSDILLIYTYLDLNVNQFANYINISIEELLHVIGVKNKRDYKKTKGYKRLIDVFNWLVLNDYIIMEQEPDLYKYDQSITIFLESRWNLGMYSRTKSAEKFVFISYDEIKKILDAKVKNTAKLFHVYMYIKSYLEYRDKYLQQKGEVAFFVQGDLANKLKIHPSQVSAYINKLYEIGMIDRCALKKTGFTRPPYIYTLASPVSNYELAKGKKYFDDYFNQYEKRKEN